MPPLPCVASLTDSVPCSPAIGPASRGSTPVTFPFDFYFFPLFLARKLGECYFRETKSGDRPAALDEEAAPNSGLESARGRWHFEGLLATLCLIEYQGTVKLHLPPLLLGL